MNSGTTILTGHAFTSAHLARKRLTLARCLLTAAQTSRRGKRARTLSG